MVAAAKNADAYLAALKIADIPEGAQALREAAWHLDELPVLQEYSKLYEGLFDTDVENVRAYKRLVQAKIQSRARTILEVKYILISYKELKTGKWRVYEFRELRSSVEEAVEYFRKKLGDTKDKDQFNYRHYAYWLMMAGN